MDHIDQTLINALIAGFGFMIGVILKAVWDAVKELQRADQELTKRVSEIEVLVAGNYVKRDDLEKYMTAVFAKLERIEQKLDGKMDK